ncbi:MAG: hypothetical protein ACLT69_15240 [Intestinibacter bartlettii]
MKAIVCLNKVDLVSDEERKIVRKKLIQLVMKCCLLIKTRSWC